jgi:hypothetical protein
MGQTEKNSVRANVFRCPPESGHAGREVLGRFPFQIQHYANLRRALPDVFLLLDGLTAPRIRSSTTQTPTISAVDIDAFSITIAIHPEAKMSKEPVDELSVSENCASAPDRPASNNVDQNSLPCPKEWIDLITPIKLPEPGDFRENTFKLMSALGSSRFTRSSTFDPVVEAQMRGAVDYLADHLFVNESRLDVIDQEQPLHPGSQIFVELYLKLITMVGHTFVRISELPPSRGYEPLLVANGWNPIAARGLAALAVRSGKRQAKEGKWHRPVFDAIRFLAVPGRQKRAILARAKVLIAAWNETSIIETAFDKAGLRETEFIKLLEATSKDENVDYKHLAKIAAEITPHLSLPRGPKISAPSAALEFFLEDGAPELVKKRRPHSRHSRSEEYCDALTEATRREFATPHFDSRSARRRSNARLGARTK